ncbi:hypothetical protein [Arthrobacter agilis]|uniref:hypothetical protein n=1 Tax=Arthrobacter agilis TaxID=37921 RepID=UPI002784EC71|nr:hypothetical protein [Arthrobacter agilis]MDQ0735332.1 hypothetical protein [Arthrobacter agilis]
MANDVTKVGVPVTGFIGLAPFGTDIPSPSEGGVIGFTLPAAYKVPGLFTTDGAPEWAMEADGDPIEFFQEGFSIPSGLANVTISVTLAQTDPVVRELTRGKTYDANGYMTVDGGGTDVKYVAFTEIIFKNGAIERRVAPNVSIQSVTEQRNTRGEVRGTEVVFNVSRSEELDNDHFAEWNTLAVAAAG